MDYVSDGWTLLKNKCIYYQLLSIIINYYPLIINYYPFIINYYQLLSVIINLLSINDAFIIKISDEFTRLRLEKLVLEK